MNNADVFKQVFGIYATELWAMGEKDFLKWLNSEHEAGERMADVISRQVALDALNRELRCGAVIDQCGLETAYEIIEELSGEELPDTQSQHKRGKWIPMSNKYIINGYWFECSECGRAVPEVRNGGWSFCPNCGASMEGE